MKKVLVISPHPDDEAIGCGGTICKHISEGDLVHIIFLTSGEKGGHGRSEEETIIVREEEAKQAAQILSVKEIEFWREPDGNFEASQNNIERFKRVINLLSPDVMYVPHEAEDHPDHKAAAELVIRYLDASDGSILTDVFMYEIWTPLQKMDLIVDITPFVEKKRTAIAAHKSQCDVMNFAEAIIGLNRYRGEMHSWPGGDYAEVFKRMEMT